MASSPADKTSPRLSRRLLVTVAILSCTVVLGTAILIWVRQHALEGDTPLYQNRAVAVLALRSSPLNQTDQWLSPALEKMLGTELSAANEVRVLPDDLVLQASEGLEPGESGVYAPGPLAQLRQRLNADFVVGGQYRLADSAGEPLLSVEIELQDARTGALLATVSKEGALSSLKLLVHQAGVELREKLGAFAATRGRLSQIASIQPPTIAVAQRLGFALDAIVRHEPARARDELLEAVEEAPDYAPSYLYLSQAWAALGYRQKALAAAQQAASRSAVVPLEMRVQIEAAVQTENYDAKRAAQSWRQLVALRPLTLEYRLELIRAEIDAGDTTAAAIALNDLRRLPQAAQDPRTELAAGQLARARNDARSQAEHAEEALRLAQLRHASGLAADAQAALADAQTRLGALDSAKTALDEAVAGYHQMENPSGEVAAFRLRAAVLESQMHHKEALAEYQRAMALAETIGDAGDVGAIYRNISSLLWMQGDREGAQASARRALDIARTTGDLRLQSWTLRALATIDSDQAATDDVLGKYREVTALTASSHDLGGHVWSLATNADTLRMRGQLDEAQTSCAQAKKEADSLSDPQFSIYTDSICASLAIDRGEPDAARVLLDKFEALSKSSGNTVYEANAEFMTGQIEFDAGHYAKAQEHARRALQGYTGAEADTGEANAEALLALCAQTLNQPGERDRAVAHARALRTTISSQQEIYLVDIALARLSSPEQRGAAAESLGKLADDAERRHWIGWSLESKFAEWQILEGMGNRAQASATRAELEKTARALGFKRILSLVNNSPLTAQ